MKFSFERQTTHPAETTAESKADLVTRLKEMPHQTPEELMVRRYIESINEAALRDCINYYVRKAGGDLKQHHFIPFDEVITYTDESYPDGSNSYGCLITDAQAILLNASLMHEQPEQVLRTLVHEELHAMTLLVHTYTINDENQKHLLAGFELPIRTKAREHGDSTDAYGVGYRPANEGFTEYLTDKIISDYMHVTGDSDQYGRDRLEANSHTAYTYERYGEYQRRMELYIELVSIITEQPADIIENAFIRAYFADEMLVPDEIFEELAQHHVSLPRIVQALLIYPDFDDIRSTINYIVNLSSFSETEKNRLEQKYLAMMQRMEGNAKIA